VIIDFVNMAVSDGATILAAIFSNLLGVISRPVAFFSSAIFLNRLKTTSRLGVFRQNALSVCERLSRRKPYSTITHTNNSKYSDNSKSLYSATSMKCPSALYRIHKINPKRREFTLAAEKCKPC